MCPSVSAFWWMLKPCQLRGIIFMQLPVVATTGLSCGLPLVLFIDT